MRDDFSVIGFRGELVAKLDQFILRSGLVVSINSRYARLPALPDMMWVGIVAAPVCHGAVAQRV